MRTTKLIKWATAGVLVAFLAGCSSTPDSVEDPLSFDVDAQLPFVTAAPEAVAATPTPEPTMPWDTSAPSQDWQNDTSADLGDQIEEGDLVNDTTVSYRQLSTGDTGEEVQRLQQRLKELKYYTGSVDGRYGSNLTTAVKRFQATLGLDTTGIATANLQRMIFSSAAPTYTGNSFTDTGNTISFGDTDDQDYDVKPTKKPSSSSSNYDDDDDDSTGYKTLSYGDTGTRVRNLQSSLKALGYYSGAVDGVYGSGTVAAVKRFEKAYGKTQTGIATVALQTKLFSGDAKPYSAPTTAPAQESTNNYVTLKPGDSGTRVKQLQQRLKELGYFTANIGGNYQTETTKAVKAFQKALGLEQTGVATASLQRKLFASSAPANTANSDSYVKLQKNDTGAWVTALQSRLKKLGYLNGSVDGVYGNATVNAVKLFEKAYGKTPTGVATVALQKTLYSKNAKPYNKPDPTPEPEYIELREGDSGLRVMAVQNRLKELGYYSGATDGNYGASTVKAIKLFEKAYGKKQTGVATVALQKTLFSDSAKPYKGATPTPAPKYVELRPGDTGEMVKRLQARLKELGYFDGEIGGNYLEKTTAAVKRFERAYGKDPTGIATVALQKTLFSDSAKPYKATTPTPAPQYVKLSPGDSGTRVKKLQQRLKDLGYFTGNVAGNYGELTTAAVKRFQKKIGMEQTGIATVKLQQALFADDAPAYKSGTTYKTLKVGSTGDAVSALQIRLMELGYLSEDQITLGKFEKSTRDAVIDAQLARGYESDGTADANFQTYIFSDEAYLYIGGEEEGDA
jgi:peptidoglycan hydrolase-like protein with peptidoglycan-binding domain